MKNKLKYFAKYTIFPAICGYVTVWSIIQVVAFANATETAVIKGESQLWCHFSDGYRQVPAELVKYQLGDTWIFENGSATACEVK